MSYDKEIILDTLHQIKEAISRIDEWSINVKSGDSYRISPEGMKTLAATCMLLRH